MINLLLSFFTAKPKLLIYTFIAILTVYGISKVYSSLEDYFTQSARTECLESTLENNDEYIEKLKSDSDEKDKLIKKLQEELNKKSKEAGKRVEETKKAVDIEDSETLNQNFIEVLKCFEESC